jgi:Protein of unknown function (DUF1573)
MKKICLLIFLVLFPATCFSQSSIVFDSESHDFGILQPGGKIEHTFDFKNNGNEELVIERLQPG